MRVRVRLRAHQNQGVLQRPSHTFRRMCMRVLFTIACACAHYAMRGSEHVREHVRGLARAAAPLLCML